MKQYISGRKESRTFFRKLNQNIVWFSAAIAIACSSLGQSKNTTKTKFKSYFGSFSMDIPRGWTQIEEHGNSSFVGKIAIDKNDTLEFDYGFWSSMLRKDKLLLSWSDKVDSLKVKKAKKKIDGYDAYLSRPRLGGTGLTCVYIDSLYSNGPTITKFILYGNHLTQKNEELFFEVVKSLKFER